MKAVLAAAAALAASASAQDTCNPSFWSAGHDFKNMQYSHGPGASAADCCAKCAKYSDKAIGQCKFWTWDGVDTCWFKSNNKGYQASGKSVVCGGVQNIAPPTPPPPPPPPPPTPPPVPTPPTPPPSSWDGKPVQVYIMLGQSNMLGEGDITGAGNTTLQDAVFRQGKYPWLKNGEYWSVYPNVRNVFIMGNGNSTPATSPVQHNEWLTPDYGDKMAGGLGRAHTTIGPEFGITSFGGTCSPGKCSQDNVVLLKSCIGDRALGWDLLPPGSPRHDFTDSHGVTYAYAGYGESPEKWVANQTKPPPIGWYAGAQWDGDTRNAEFVLQPENLPTFFPSTNGGATKAEVAGFFWWQGDKDSRDEGLSAAYETNLVQFIKQLRTVFNAPDAPFVTASLGQTVAGSTSGDGEILDAMLNVGCNGETQGVATKCKYPEFKGNVAAVYTNPLMNTPSSSGGHYSGDAITYTNIGYAMGAEMAKMKKLL